MGTARLLYIPFKMADWNHILLLLVLMVNIRGGMSYCNIKHVDVVTCWVNVECFVEIREPISTQQLCLNNNDTRYEITLKSPSDFYKPRSENISYLNKVIRFRATGNKWKDLPYKALKHMPYLDLLVLHNNRISNLTEKSMPYLTELRYLDLSFNQITYIDVNTFYTLIKLEKLFLDHNRIGKVDADTFRLLSGLIELDLSYNSLLELQVRSFSGLHKLETLKLNHNNIFVFNGALKHLHSLKYLYLRENKLHQINVSEIPYFKHLQILDITNNTLSSIEPEVFTRHWFGMRSLPRSKVQKQIVQILLSRNKIVTLENSSFIADTRTRHTRQNPVEELDLPTEIDLSHNIIESIEFDAFNGIEKLQSLDLSYNYLTDFYVNTSNLDQLKRLRLQNNLIKEIFTHTFHNLGSLKTLDLSENKIFFLEDNAFHTLRDLTILKLSKNYLTDLDSSKLDRLNSLKYLDLSNNEVNETNVSDLQLPGLKNLILHSNDIRDMTLVRLYYLLELEGLDLSRNVIEDIDNVTLSHIQALKHLNLSSNKIASINPSTFAKMPALITLDLSENNLTRIDYGTFQGLNKLSKLDLSYNHIEFFESKVLFDLKSLEYLALDMNGMIYIDISMFRGRRVPINLSVEGNKLRCSWLATALKDVDNGWSGVRLLGGNYDRPQKSIGGIACEEDSQDLTDYSDISKTYDDRLLLTNQKILNAILSQTAQLKIAIKKLAYVRNVPSNGK